MRIKFLLVFFTFTLLWGFLLPQITLADAHTLSGTVSNSSGSNISGATIDVKDSSSGASVGNTTTDSSGNYSISLTDGTYNVQATPPTGSGLSSAIALGQNISSDKTLNFILTPAGNVTLSGRVLDALGNPVPGQRVRFGNISSITNSSGVYSITASPGTQTLTVGSDPNGVPNYTRNVPTSYSISVFNFALTQITLLDLTIPAKKVTAHVQNSSNTPLSGVGVSGGTFGNPTVPLGSNLNGFVDSGSYSGGPVTNSSGDTILWLLPTTTTNSSVSFTATPQSGSGYLTTTLQNVSITEDTTQTITMNDPVILSGHVYDELGNAVPGQRVRFGNTSSITNSSGVYTLSVAPGTQSIRIDPDPNSPPNYTRNVPTDYLITVDSYTVSQNTQLDLTIPARKVTVRVENSANDPVPGVAVSAGTFGNPTIPLGNNLNGFVSSSSYSGGPVTNSSGDAVVWVLPTVTLNSFVNFTATPQSGSGYLTTNLQNVEILEDTTKTITMQQQPVTLSGRVLDSLGNPVPGQKISFGSISSISNSSGVYSITVAPGTQTLEIGSDPNSPPNYSQNVPTSYLIRVNSYTLSQTKTVDLTVPAKKVTVHVQDEAENNPVVGALVNGGTFGNPTVSLGDNLTGNVISASYTDGPLTNSSGDTVLWLLPTTTQNSFANLTIEPPSGSVFETFTLNNIQITGEQTEIVSLQYNHERPVTNISLATERENGEYSNPTTVTLAATAASGYTIANTYYKVDGGSQQTYSAPFTVSGNGEHTIEYWSVDNSGVPEAHKTKSFTIYVNQPPHVDPLSDAAINQGGTYTATGSFTDEDSTSWTATVDYGDIGGAPEPLTLTGNTFTLSHEYTTPGTYTVTVVITDDSQNTGTTNATVTVNARPQIDSLTDGTINEGQAYAATGSFTDEDSTSWTATVNYDDGSGVQALTLSGTTFALNHTYKDNGSYTISVSVTDNQGAVSTETATVTVTNVAPAVGAITVNPSPAHINSAVTASASFTDPGVLDTHTATINWGDGNTTPGTVNETTGTVSGNHTYASFGTFIITVTVIDKDTAVGNNTTSLIVVKQLTAVSPATVYISKTLPIIVTRFDLKAEVYKDNTLVTSGQLNSVNPGLGATAVTIPFNSFSAIDFPAGSALKIQVYARTACTGALLANGTARLYYNANSVDSRFGATIGATNSTYHLLNGFVLGAASGTSQQIASVNAGAKCSEFKPFGTWTITP